MLYKSILHNRIGKWALILIEFSLNFLPLKATKGQIVANFLADHTHVEILECFVGIKPWVLYFNGSKHVHGSRIGIVIISLNNMPLIILFEIRPACSNNETKYEALLTSLETLIDLSVKHVFDKGRFKISD